PTAVGAAVMVGLDASAPLAVNRYGGRYASIVSSHVPCSGFEPATSTVASGIRSATEWYIRGRAMVPARVQVSVSGSKRSAPRLAVLAVLFCTEPPSARTLPVGRSTAFIWMRGADIEG